MNNTDEFYGIPLFTPPADWTELLRGGIYGTEAKDIYKKCCKKFVNRDTRWDARKKGVFAEQKEILHIENAITEKVFGGTWGVCFLTHAAMAEKQKIEIDGNFLHIYYGENDAAPAGSSQLFFAENSRGQYVFLGDYYRDKYDAEAKKETYKLWKEKYPFYPLVEKKKSNYKILLRQLPVTVQPPWPHIPKDDPSWYFSLHLDGYILGESVADSPCAKFVYRCEDEAEGNALAKKMDWNNQSKGTVVTAKGLPIGEGKKDLFRLLKIKKVAVGKRLNAVAKSLLEREKNPPRFVDAELGEFIWSNFGSCFNGETKIKNRQVGLSIDAKADLELLRRVCKLQFIDEARNYAVDNLLDLANDWRQQVTEKTIIPLTREQLLKAFKISLISMHGGERVSFWFDDKLGRAEIFGGHAPTVEWSEKDGFHNANIQ